MDLYSTYFMLAAVKRLPLMQTFFRDRYFPSNTLLDIFGSAKVWVDVMEGNKKLAPFVVPRIGGINILRDGFETYELEPANIALSRSLTYDNLKNRGFGEALNSQMTPADRESSLLIDDMRELSDRITRREEWMAVNTILGNGCIMKHITDKEAVFEDVEVMYYKNGDNQALYTPAQPWTEKNDSWRKDVKAMGKRLSEKGLPATDLIVAPDVGEYMLRDEHLLKLLDITRVEMGRINPKELPNGATYLGAINFEGKLLDILVYEGTYEDESGKDTPYLPDGTVIVTAPNCGHTLYGGVTQIEDDGAFHTIAGTRVPQYVVTKKPAVKEVTLTSKPLMAPKAKDPWIVAKNVFH